MNASTEKVTDMSLITSRLLPIGVTIAKTIASEEMGAYAPAAEKALGDIPADLKASNPWAAFGQTFANAALAIAPTLVSGGTISFTGLFGAVAKLFAAL